MSGNLFKSYKKLVNSKDDVDTIIEQLKELTSNIERTMYNDNKEWNSAMEFVLKELSFIINKERID